MKECNCKVTNAWRYERDKKITPISCSCSCHQRNKSIEEDFLDEPIPIITDKEQIEHLIQTQKQHIKMIIELQKQVSFFREAAQTINANNDRLCDEILKLIV